MRHLPPKSIRCTSHQRVPASYQWFLPATSGSYQLALMGITASG